jgi:hypothetical protein
MRPLMRLNAAVVLMLLVALSARAQQSSAEEKKAAEAIRASGGWAGQSPDPKNPEKFAQLTGTRADDKLMKLLKDIGGLKRVTLRDTAVTADGLAQLEQCKDLQSLSIEGEKVTAKHLKAIATLKGLRELRMRPTDFTDADLEQLAGLENLEQLSIGGKVGDKGVATLAKFMRLRVLEFSGAPITEGVLRQLSVLENLERLRADSPDVTDAAVKQLKEFKKLRHLSLVSPDLTDAGLKRLAELKSLESISIAYRKLSMEARLEFAKAFPRTKPEDSGVDYWPWVMVVEREEVKIDPNEDEVRKLLKARYNAAVRQVNGIREQVLAGKNPLHFWFDSLDALLGYAVELEEDPKKQLLYLEQRVELAGAVEEVMQARYEAGSAPIPEYQRARYARLDAEIQLLRFKRKLESTKPE